MKSLFAFVSVMLAAGIGISAEPPEKTPTAAEEMRRLQGTWQVEEWEEGGKTLTAADLKSRAVFFGGSVFVFRRDAKMLQGGVVRLDPSESPRTADLVIREGEGKGGVMLAVYTLEGDTLRLCLDPEGRTRPEDFKPEAKAGFTRITLRKLKPAVAEVVEIAGRFRSEMSDAGGKLVVTDVVVEKRGDGYLLTYTLDGKVLFVGTALRKGDQLSMCWASAGQIGVSVYKIEAGPRLTGEYTVLGGIGMTGKEVLTPWKKID